MRAELVNFRTEMAYRNDWVFYMVLCELLWDHSNKQYSDPIAWENQFMSYLVERCHASER